MQTAATYFDGESSTPHQVELFYDDRSNDLLFLSSDYNNKRWRVEDIEFHKLDFCVEISNKAYPLELLKITNQDFIAFFIAQLNQNGQLSIYQKLLHLGFKVHIAIACILIAFIAIGYFYLVPFVAEKSVAVIPLEFDDYLSNEFLVDYFADNKVDTLKTELLTEFGSKLNFRNRRPYTFVVVKSDIINAFALPNAKIIVFTGLLDKMQSYEELTALLSHEAVHINNRHSVKMLARNLAGYIFISAMFSDVNGIMTVIAENAENLNALSYSRKFENEADREGLQLMFNNHVNARGMLNLFQRIKSDEKALPSFLSTHPVTDERMAEISKQINNSKANPKQNQELKQIFNKIKSLD
ncbi:MAG: M48 family metallopeptidase [Paludibacter sp.]